MSDMSEKDYEKSIVDRKKQEGTVLRSSFFLFFIATFWGNFYSNLCNRENKNTEWALVGQAKKGDAHAFALLYQRYYKELFYFALSVVKHKEMAEDVVGNAVLHAYEYLPSLKKDTAFKSWLFQITANECKRQLKKKVVSVEDYLLEEVETDEKGFSEVEISEYLKVLTAKKWEN